jgi:hypothetical protein
LCNTIGERVTLLAVSFAPEITRTPPLYEPSMIKDPDSFTIQYFNKINGKMAIFKQSKEDIATKDNKS